MNILLDLFLTFAKIGLFTFGGGYAMISMIENNCVERKQWITHDEMMNVTVIAESTPDRLPLTVPPYWIQESRIYWRSCGYPRYCRTVFRCYLSDFYVFG